jgi:hypothetical protein
MKCPVCKGKKGYKLDLGYAVNRWYKCKFCDGKGKVPFYKWLHNLIWSNMPDFVIDILYDIEMRKRG